jgi:hypothetical protein
VVRKHFFLVRLEYQRRTFWYKQDIPVERVFRIIRTVPIYDNRFSLVSDIRTRLSMTLLLDRTLISDCVKNRYGRCLTGGGRLLSEMAETSSRCESEVGWARF